MTKALPRRLQAPIPLRLAFLTAGFLFLACASTAQSRTEEAEYVKPATEEPALDQEGAGAPTLNREVKQDLSKAPSSPDAPARREEQKEHKGPVSLQPFVEPEPEPEPEPAPEQSR